MKYLLDTHTWIWWHMRPSNLSEKVLQLISDHEKYSELLLSAISPWENAIILTKDDNIQKYNYVKSIW